MNMNRVISALVGLSYIVTTLLLCPSVLVLKTMLLLLTPMTLIWFGKDLASGRNEEVTGNFMVIIGWFFLLAPLIGILLGADAKFFCARTLLDRYR